MKKIAFILLVVAVPGIVSAQDAFEQWKKKQEAEFQAFKDARDKEFSGMLKEAWQFMKDQEAMKPYARPKVDQPPKAPVEAPKPAAPVKQTPAAVEKPPVAKAAAAVPESVVSAVPAQAPATAGEPVRPSFPVQSITWFGLTASFPFDPALKNLSLKARSDKEIAFFFEALARSAYEPTVAAIAAHQKNFRLNDWALGVAIEKFAASVFSGNDEQLLFTWFLLNKGGYAARIGYNDKGICLLIPSDIRIFGAKYFTIDNTRFYTLRFSGAAQDPGPVYTYEGSYPKADKTFDFSLDALPAFPQDEATREVTFTWKEKTHTVTLRYNRNTIAFMQQYPQADLPVYFRGQLSGNAAASLESALRPLVEGQSEWDAVNLLMRFVQNAFAYKTDEDQFGFEKYFFAEETLHYPFSDCEDRSILFAYLVKKLLGNDVVGLRYPGHLATAVAFKSVPGGDAFDIAGKTYTVCDPTYINADAGMTMPDFKAASPTVVQF
jgi:hypothetical protein